MKKIYCKQIPPEYQEDDLFWIGKDKDNRSQLHWENDAYDDDVVICGNNDYQSYYTKAYEKVLKNIDDAIYEYENRLSHWKNFSEIIDYYFTKENGKKYSKKQIHKWKYLTDYWQDSEEDYLQAIELITGKKWRQVCIKGCCQRNWQYLYASEEVSDKDIDYIGMCYFNTGEEWLMYESKKDLKNNENAVSFYIDGWNRKTNLAERLGCEEKQIHLYQFTGYKKIPQYEEVE